MRLRLIIGLSIILLLQSCRNDKDTPIIFPESGYDYPKQFNDSDTLLYIYPIKDVISNRDSFHIATYSEFLYKSFDEPNLSLTPSDAPVFRLVYQPGFTRYTAILTLKKQKIIIKELATGYAVPYTDTERLDSLERRHYSQLDMHFPIVDWKGSPRKEKYLDSLAKQYPQLLNANYYRNLLNKASDYGAEKFTYTQREIALTKKQYNYFLNLLNQSGYWKAKPIIDDCPGQITHPDGFYLEASTPNKYNFVSYTECRDDTSGFFRACNELMKYSKLQDNDKKWHDELYKKIKKK